MVQALLDKSKLTLTDSDSFNRRYIQVSTDDDVPSTTRRRTVTCVLRACLVVASLVAVLRVVWLRATRAGQRNVLPFDSASIAVPLLTRPQMSASEAAQMVLIC